MPSPGRLLSTYLYDPLDRLVGTHALLTTQRFYNRERLTTERQGLVSHSVFQYDHHLLAEKQSQGQTALLATDLQRSVLHSMSATGPRAQAYSAYGHHRAESGLGSLLGFNGEQADPLTGHYLLGNGHRAYNPVLMRFNSPDRLSPFGKGGFNAYAYCVGDPVNKVDPSGRLPLLNTLALVSGIANLASQLISTMPTKGFRPAWRALKNHAAGFEDVIRITTTAAAHIGTVSLIARSTLSATDNIVGNVLLATSSAMTALSLTGNAALATKSWWERRVARAAGDVAYSGGGPEAVVRYFSSTTTTVNSIRRTSV